MTFGWILIGIGVLMMAFALGALLALATRVQVAIEDPTDDPIVDHLGQRVSMESCGLPPTRPVTDGGTT